MERQIDALIEIGGVEADALDDAAPGLAEGYGDADHPPGECVGHGGHFLFAKGLLRLGELHVVVDEMHEGRVSIGGLGEVHHCGRRGVDLNRPVAVENVLHGLAEQGQIGGDSLVPEAFVGLSGQEGHPTLAVLALDDVGGRLSVMRSEDVGKGEIVTDANFLVVQGGLGSGDQAAAVRNEPSNGGDVPVAHAGRVREDENAVSVIGGEVVVQRDVEGDVELHEGLREAGEVLREVGAALGDAVGVVPVERRRGDVQGHVGQGSGIDVEIFVCLKPRVVVPDDVGLHVLVREEGGHDVVRGAVEGGGLGEADLHLVGRVGAGLVLAIPDGRVLDAGAVFPIDDGVDGAGHSAGRGRLQPRRAPTLQENQVDFVRHKVGGGTLRASAAHPGHCEVGVHDDIGV